MYQHADEGASTGMADGRTMRRNMKNSCGRGSITGEEISGALSSTGGSLGDCKSWREANRYKHTSRDKRVRLQNLLCVGMGGGGSPAAGAGLFPRCRENF